MIAIAKGPVVMIALMEVQHCLALLPAGAAAAGDAATVVADAAVAAGVAWRGARPADILRGAVLPGAAA